MFVAVHVTVCPWSLHLYQFRLHPTVVLIVIPKVLGEQRGACRGVHEGSDFDTVLPARIHYFFEIERALAAAIATSIAALPSFLPSALALDDSDPRQRRLELLSHSFHRFDSHQRQPCTSGPRRQAAHAEIESREWGWKCLLSHSRRQLRPPSNELRIQRRGGLYTNTSCQVPGRKRITRLTYRGTKSITRAVKQAVRFSAVEKKLRTKLIGRHVLRILRARRTETTYVRPYVRTSVCTFSLDEGGDFACELPRAAT